MVVGRWTGEQGTRHVLADVLRRRGRGGQGLGEAIQPGVDVPVASPDETVGKQSEERAIGQFQLGGLKRQEPQAWRWPGWHVGEGDSAVSRNGGRWQVAGDRPGPACTAG